MRKLLPAKIGDLVIVQPQPAEYDRTVVVECIHKDGRIGVFMPCWNNYSDQPRVPKICYYNDSQYTVLARGWQESLDKARREKAEADEAERIKPGDFVRVTNRVRQFASSAFWPGSVYRVVRCADNAVDVKIEDSRWCFRLDEVEKVHEKDRFDNED